ncbi:hypothetical protein, partial [Klebsiella pneumoniae]
ASQLVVKIGVAKTGVTIDSVFQANPMEDYNRRFAKPPCHDFDVHRQLDNGENLQATFTWRGLLSSW